MPRYRHASVLTLVGLLLVSSCERPGVDRSARGTRPHRALVPSGCPSQPNVLIISLDTLRFDATSLAPAGRNATPHLASLANRGFDFKRTYSTHDSTPPSHFSMLTGYVVGGRRLDRVDSSIAFQLKGLGYRTWGITANGNLSPKSSRTYRSFDSFVNLLDEWQSMPPERRQRWTALADSRLDAYAFARHDWNRMMVYSSSAAPLPFVERQLDQPQPFLGFINLLHAHDPYLPSPAFHDRASEKVNVPDLRLRPLPQWLQDPAGIRDERFRARVEATLTNAGERAWSTTLDLRPEQVAVYRERYLAAVRELDAALGRVISMLRERELLDSTIIVVTSDHGESFGEKDLLTHSFENRGDLESTRRVPMVIVLPPCFGARARVIEDRASIADVAPTIYALLGIDASALWARTTPLNVGRPLSAYFGIGPGAAGTRPAARQPSDKGPTPEESAAEDEEARRRLRALGYIQ